MASATILPHTFIALRLPSGTHRVVKVAPDTSITLGKYGSVNTNLLLGRPYYLTYEILENSVSRETQELRIVPASEIRSEALSEDASAPSESNYDQIVAQEGRPQAEDLNDKGEIFMRDNRLTIDDPARQALTMDDIEELKKADKGSGKDIIAKIMNSHSALDEKTAFSLAKYTLRKSKKYLKRFTVLPLDVSVLAGWLLTEREPSKIMELREEMLGLIASWSNVHSSGLDARLEDLRPNARMLVVDDTGGLIVATLAERMGLLQPSEEILTDEDSPSEHVKEREHSRNTNGNASPREEHSTSDSSRRLAQPHKPKRYPADAQSATDNSITLIHPATQPNIALLGFFSFDPADPSSKSTAIPSSSHPLHTHLKTVSLLQLVSPELDGSYEEPESIGEDELKTWKSSQRGNYFRKRRRWERTKRVVDDTRAGGFDGLVVASAMTPISILHLVVPLLKGGARICVYHPNIEPLAELADCYSSSRKTAFLNARAEEQSVQPHVPSEDFPLDPRLLLAPSIQTARAREWQVLPGRTHPIMTSVGAAEGYLFTATRVVPVEGKVEARGRFSKKRKVVLNNDDLGRHSHVPEPRYVNGNSSLEENGKEKLG